MAIEHFSNERRATMENRPVIALDFAGDAKAATHGIAEDASKHLSATLWVDERDMEVRRVQARLNSPFRLEMGLLSLSQGSTFTFDQKIINNEVWLPTGASAHIEARAALFLGYHIQLTIVDDQYKRFRRTPRQQGTHKRSRRMFSQRTNVTYTHPSGQAFTFTVVYRGGGVLRSGPWKQLLYGLFERHTCAGFFELRSSPGGHQYSKRSRAERALGVGAERR